MISRPARRTTTLAALFFVVTTAFLVWPLYPWLGDHVEPRVLGIPWSLVYVLLIVGINTAALTGLYVARAIDAEEHPEGGGG